MSFEAKCVMQHHSIYKAAKLACAGSVKVMMLKSYQMCCKQCGGNCDAHACYDVPGHPAVHLR
jgi:hypothetical protein